MKLLQINTTVNTGSTGGIAEDIGRTIIEKGGKSYIAYSRKGRASKSELIHIGSKKDIYIHGLYTRFFDRHGFASKKATKKLINQINTIEPDVIGLHNLHGYYLHVQVLFEYLKTKKIPLVWTFHDCWPFTGHCAYFDIAGCEKWKTHCGNCPCRHKYPKSWFVNNSYKNFEDKRKAFTGHPNLTIVTPSYWLKNLVKQSFLKEYRTRIIHNGINLNKFRPIEYESLNTAITKAQKIVLGVANVWEPRKGLNDFIELSKIVPAEYRVVLIGLNKKQKKRLPNNIIGISRTENIEKLVGWYSRADVFVNPTYEDNFPTTNIEALACGTPVVTYDTGGSPETIDGETGLIVNKKDISDLCKAIKKIIRNKKNYSSISCRKRVRERFNKEDRYLDYYNLYKSKALVTPTNSVTTA